MRILGKDRLIYKLAGLGIYCGAPLLALGMGFIIFIKKLICIIFGHIYPEKKLPTPTYLIEMFPEYKDPRTGAFVADLSKPCARCGKYTKEKL